MLKRPKLALTPNAKIPTNLRQKYLDCYIDEFMKMNVKPEEAYEKVSSVRILARNLDY